MWWTGWWADWWAGWWSERLIFQVTTKLGKFILNSRIPNIGQVMPWSFVDYTYSTAENIPPEVTSPTPRSTITGGTADFKWKKGKNINVVNYRLSIGTEQDNWNIFDQVLGSKVEAQSIASLPTDGSKIHVRLWWET